MPSKKGKAKPVTGIEMRLLDIADKMGKASSIQVDAQKELLDLLKEMRRSDR